MPGSSLALLATWRLILSGLFALVTELSVTNDIV